MEAKAELNGRIFLLHDLGDGRVAVEVLVEAFPDGGRTVRYLTELRIKDTGKSK
jgi:hypothetical protein